MPSYSGRLIFPQIGVFYQLDTVGTTADPDGAGPLTSGYDHDLGDVIPYDVGSPAVRTSSRREKSPIRVPVQVETERYDATQQVGQGNTQEREMTLVMHAADLKVRGLIDADGMPTIRRGDRLAEIRHKKTNALIMSVTLPHGLYVEEVRPCSFGLSGGDRNLFLVILSSRSQGV